MSLDARLLTTFRAVATAGKMSAAARALHLSQPAVTAQIRQLEEQCGVPLLVRSVRGVTPTPAGRELLGYSEKIESLLGEALAAVSAKPIAEGELVIGASTTIAGYVLPLLLVDFCRAMPGVRVRIDVANTERIIEWVSEGAVPLGLVEGLSRAPRLRMERFIEDELWPVVANDASAELRRVRRVADLASVPVIWREGGSGTRAVVERAIKTALGKREAHAGDLQIGSTEGIKTAAMAGLGIAFLSRWSIRNELASGKLRLLELPDLVVRRNFSFAMPAASVPGLAGEFLRHARLAAPRLAP